MRCPFCKEELFDGASRCSKCNQTIPDVERPGEKIPEGSSSSSIPAKTPSSEKQRQDEIARAGGVNRIAIALLPAIAILGIIAAIAIPQFVKYKEVGYCRTAKTDIQVAYTVAQAYYGRHQNANLPDIRQLEEFGFKPSKYVDLQIINGSYDSMIISAKHSSCKKTYYADSSGNVSDSAPDIVTVTAPAPASATTAVPASTPAVAPVPVPAPNK
jgi:type IV pilus assembly protein PilA